MAAYEMNHFRDEYQKAVLANAKAFAKALKGTSLDVAGEAAVGFTETHQVIVNVGYAGGPALAERLQENNIIVNYQAGPYDEGFSAAGSLRLGVAEMTRFGMGRADFEVLAQLVHDVIAKNQSVVDEVKSLRKRFGEMRFCFSGGQFEQAVQRLHELV